MAREILNPRWGNEEKTQIIAKFRYDDGRVLNAAITIPEGDGLTNPDWDEIMTNFGSAYLDKETADQLAAHKAKKTQIDDQRKLNVERQQKETLFNAKAEAFDMTVVKNSKNREIKNKIRRASSIMEIMVYTAMLHMMEDPIANPVNDTMDDTSTSANTESTANTSANTESTANTSANTESTANT
jgi:hypothetical protein